MKILKTNDYDSGSGISAAVTISRYPVESQLFYVCYLIDKKSPNKTCFALNSS